MSAELHQLLGKRVRVYQKGDVLGLRTIIGTLETYELDRAIIVTEGDITAVINWNSVSYVRNVEE